MNKEALDANDIKYILGLLCLTSIKLIWLSSKDSGMTQDILINYHTKLAKGSELFIVDSTQEILN